VGPHADAGGSARAARLCGGPSNTSDRGRPRNATLREIVRLWVRKANSSRAALSPCCRVELFDVCAPRSARGRRRTGRGGPSRLAPVDELWGDGVTRVQDDPAAHVPQGLARSRGVARPWLHVRAPRARSEPTMRHCA
jgi:hypothetical protein